MRPLRLDITGTTDANGNASIPVKLPQTGEWHDVKFAMSISAPAEWAVLVSGTAVTYGRGRRVTLGPELIQDGETVTVTVTGGPTAAAIIGGATGKSGSPDEILAAFVPQPNTIALDVSQLPSIMGQMNAGAGATPTQTFRVPPGTVAVGIQDIGGGTIAPKITLTGHQSGSTVKTVYFPQQSTGIYTALWDPAEDTQIDVTIDNSTSGTASSAYIFLAYPFVPGTVGPPVENATPPFPGTNTPPSIGTIVTSNGTDPAPWQAASSFVAINANVLGGGTTAVLAGVAGQRVYCHGYAIGTDGANAVGRVQLQESGGGQVLLDLDCNATRGQIAVGTLSGARTAVGKGLIVINSGGAASFLAVNLAYTQAP